METFNGPYIRKLVKGPHFIESINDVDQELRHLSNQGFRISLEIEKQATRDS